MTLDRETIALRIRAVRHRRKMSQHELARRAGIHRVSLANIERGAKLPTLSTLQRLATALRVPLVRLLS